MIWLEFDGYKLRMVSKHRNKNGERTFIISLNRYHFYWRWISNGKEPSLDIFHSPVNLDDYCPLCATTFQESKICKQNNYIQKRFWELVRMEGCLVEETPQLLKYEEIFFS